MTEPLTKARKGLIGRARGRHKTASVVGHQSGQSSEGKPRADITGAIKLSSTQGQQLSEKEEQGTSPTWWMSIYREIL